MNFSLEPYDIVFVGIMIPFNVAPVAMFPTQPSGVLEQDVPCRCLPQYSGVLRVLYNCTTTG